MSKIRFYKYYVFNYKIENRRLYTTSTIGKKSKKNIISKKHIYLTL